MAKVLLTGAGGFIGSHVAALFARQNIPLKCLIRPHGDVSFLEQLNVELAWGDIRQLKTIQSALRDVDFVIHTAGRSSDWGKRADFYANNVLGTMNVLRACKLANIGNVVITGSISSYGEENCQAPKSEGSPSNSHYHYFLDGFFPSAMNFYRDSKALLTQRATAFAQANQINLTVIEPVWVYGERELNVGFYSYLKAVREGMKYAPGSRSNKLHLIYAGDLAQAYLLAWQKKLPGVQRVIIGNPQAEKLHQTHKLFCAAALIKPPKLLPKALVYPLGFGMELFATLLSQKQPPLLTRARVNMMYDNIEYTVSKARELLGFEARTPLQEGIQRTVDWYVQHGFFRKPNRSKP